MYYHNFVLWSLYTINNDNTSCYELWLIYVIWFMFYYVYIQERGTELKPFISRVNSCSHINCTI